MLEDHDDSIKADTPIPYTERLPAKEIHDPAELFKTYKFDALNQWAIYGYGLGHFLNDLTASFWFNFSLFFLVTVAKTEAAAVTFLVGQVVDSFCTPLVGYLSDRFSSPLGQRTPWYIAGYLIIIGTFPFIFRVVHYGRLGDIFYYSTFAGLFNVGWACVQISHMSLVPSVSCSKSRRNRLNNFRNTATFVANFILLALASIFFSMNGDHANYFLIIALILVSIGSITTFFFLFNFREPKLTAACVAHRQELYQIVKQEVVLTLDNQQNNFRWYDWFKKSSFYFYGLAYVTARLSINVMITMLPFYVKRMEDSTDHDITISLLILYLASIVTSTKTKDILNCFGAKWILLLGFLLSILASGILQAASNTDQQKMFLFLATGVIGAAQAIILNSVINFICDIIGSNASKGGFVFGSYSFMDKISTGVVVYLVSNNRSNLDKFSYVKILILLIPPALSLASCLMVCFALPKNTSTGKDQEPKTLLEKQLI